MKNMVEKLKADMIQAMKEKDYLISKWKQYIENDKFYNPNFSLHKQFYLDKHKKQNGVKYREFSKR